MSKSDSELLQSYVVERSELAFAELVRRHIDLVFSAALRQTAGDRQLAEDVTQNVFSDLARKAARLQTHTSLGGWLYTSTRFRARSARRSDRRRQTREQQAFVMNQLLQTETGIDWEQLRPWLDDAMHALSENDRQAVLLRFFNRLPLAEVGARLAVSENTARMRVERAVDKLRGRLAKRGFTSTTAVLATLLSNYAVHSAPANLAVTVTSCALAAGATLAAGGLTTLLGLKSLLAGAAVVALLVAVPVLRHSTNANANSSATLAAQASSVNTSPTTTASPGTVPGSVRSAARTSGPAIVLHILNRANNGPIAGVQIDCRAWSQGNLEHRMISADSGGVARVFYPADTTNLVLVAEKDGYADTKLTWEPDHGEAIPESYVMRPDPAVPISGHVVDEQGQPIVGATLEWSAVRNFEAPDRLSPESHAAEKISATTDAQGRWHLERIADDLIHRLEAAVTHPQYGTTHVGLGSADPAMDRQLRDGSLVVTLRYTITVRGTVVDAGGKPVAGATVLVGQLLQRSRRQSTTFADGTFAVDGCLPGEYPITATADGFAPAAIRTNIVPTLPPVRLTLQPIQTLRLRVVAPDGTPIPGATVGYDRMGYQGPLTTKAYPDLAVAQVAFRDTSGPDGRVTWTNPPGGQLLFAVVAPGFTLLRDAPARADGQEHLITLTRGTLVTGTVRDDLSGAVIPRFRVVLGFPQRQGSFGPPGQPIQGRPTMTWITNITWINNRVTQFKDGMYSQDLNRPLVIGLSNVEYVLKFEAVGYDAFVSRVFAEGEGEVHLDVSLRPSQEPVITVLTLDGRPAKGADVGMVSPGAGLRLGQGSFVRDPLTTAVLETGVDGRFRLTSVPGVTRIIIACDEGYLSVSPQDLRNSAVVRLQPWGSIKGTCVIDGKPAAGQRYKLALENESLDGVMCDLQVYEVVSDTNGQFTIQRAPPGTNTFQRVTTGTGPNGPFKSLSPQGQTPVSVRPGETTSITLQP